MIRRRIIELWADLPLRSLFRQRTLLLRLVQFDLASRYKGSWLGILWAFVIPVLMLGLYTCVFGGIFGVRWPSGDRTISGTTPSFAAVLFSGMIIFGIFSESVLRGSQSIYSQPNFVKKLVFPVVLLPVASVITAFLHGLLSLFVLLVFELVTRGSIPWVAWQSVIVLIPVVLLSCGAAWFFASVSVYVRDVSQFLGIAMTGLMFLSPIFFPLEQVPAAWRDLILLNPLCSPIESLRSTVIHGVGLDMVSYVRSLAISIFGACVGYIWFQKTRTGFADVL